MKTRVAIVDDHELIHEALSSLIRKTEKYQLIFAAENGQDFIEKLEVNDVDLVLMDIQMPIMDGFETTLWLKLNRPDIKVLAISMNDSEETIVKMIKNGAKGFLTKDCRHSELKEALDMIQTVGFYYSTFITDKLVGALNQDIRQAGIASLLSEREMQFVKLACSENTYNQIAEEMCVSIKTLDNYRITAWDKMGVSTRVGMVLEAVRLGIITI